MSKPHFIISEKDKSMLNSGRLVSHPLEFGELLTRLPEDASNAYVKGAYRIEKSDPRGKANCAYCHQPRNHWGGIVIAFPDDTHASVGNECCEKLGHDFKVLYEDFNKDTSRIRLLTKLQLAIDLFPEVIAHMEALQSMPQIEQGRELHRKLFYHFGKLGEFLGSSKGILNALVPVLNQDEMTKRKDRRDRKVERLQRDMEARGQKFDPAANFSTMFPNDPDFQTDDIMTKKPRPHTTFSGSYFFASFGNVIDDLQAATEAIFRTLWVYHNKASGDCKTEQIRKSLIAFEGAITRAIKKVENINEGLAVFGPLGPIKSIMGWAKAHADDSIRIGGSYNWKPGKVICTFQSGPNREVEYTSMPPLPVGPLPKALARLRQGAMPEAVAA